MDKEEMGMGVHRFLLYMCMNDNQEAFAMSALKRMVNTNTTYVINISEGAGDDDDSLTAGYTGKLSCNARGTEFVFYDDANDVHGMRTGQARRELGVVVFGQETQGQVMPLEVAVPRVQQDGAAAQFRPRSIGDAMLQQYKSGITKHLFVLKGYVQLVPGGKVVLRFRGGDSAPTVLEAFRASEDRWTIRYRHPLSALQAFNVAIAVLNNPTTNVLEMLPPLTEVPNVPQTMPSPQLVKAQGLHHGYTVVYSICVHGSRIFCGLQSGHVQHWQCPFNGPPRASEWRAHSAIVYALLVTGRYLISASEDNLLRVWDLHTLHLVSTLAGHRGRVRCLAGGLIGGAGLVFSGSNDRTVRVWDMAAVEGISSRRHGTVLKGHATWVRSLCCTSDRALLCSAGKEVRVWSTAKLSLLHVLPVGLWVYSLAVCLTSVGLAQIDTLYAGCSDGVIRFWRLSQLDSSHLESHALTAPVKSLVRALAFNGTILYAGYSDGRMCAWDLRSKPIAQQLAGHRASVRVLASDPVSNMLFSCGNDRRVWVWAEGGSQD